MLELRDFTELSPGEDRTIEPQGHKLPSTTELGSAACDSGGENYEVSFSWLSP